MINTCICILLCLLSMVALAFVVEYAWKIAVRDNRRDKTKDKLQEVIDFFEKSEGWDKDDLLTDMLEEINQLRGYSANEIGLKCDGTDLGVLQDLIDEFYEKMIEGVCNVLKAFKDEPDTV